jgi:hypothetical protein
MTTATVATAAMGPLAYLVFHPSPIPVNRLVIWDFPNYLVGMATASERREGFCKWPQTRR